jgi:protein tyrosine/serine phosphatase
MAGQGGVLGWLKRLRKRESDWRDRMGRSIATPEMRREAWWHFYLIDHGLLRVWWTGFHKVAPGVWRANQPSVRRLEQWQAQGIRTVLNLRGEGFHSWYLLEREACDRLGIDLIDHRLYAKALASRAELLDLIAIFRRIEKPFVMHCKSGSDRSGFAAVIYRHLIEGEPLDRAMHELSWRYFHLRASKNGVLDHFFDAFRLDHARTGVDLETWIATTYDPAALERDWRAVRRFHR